MAITLYEKTPGALIPSSERSVSTYDSGLVRVDQVYTCATDNAATHRASFAVGSSMPDGNDSPAIDGLQLVHTPQEITRQDGFTDFIVSAYGRTSNILNNFERTIRTVDFGSFFFSLSVISGEMTTKRGEALAYGDLGLIGDFVTPFGFIPKTINDEIRSVQAVEGGASVANFVNWDGYVIQLYTRQYLVSVYFATNDSVRNVYLSVTDPVLAIDSPRTYGLFSEVQLTTSQTYSNSTPGQG